MEPSRVASSQGPTGPGRRFGAAGACRWRYTVARETFQQRATRTKPYTRSTEGETARLIASTSGVPKGRRPPGERSSLATARSPWSSRRPYLQPHNLVVAVVAVALLERRLRGQQGPIPPFRQPRRRDVELPCQQLQWFAPQQPAYYSQLPLRRVALRRWPAGGLVSASFLGALRQAHRLHPALLRHSVHSGSPSFAVRLTAAECLNKP